LDGPTLGDGFEFLSEIGDSASDQTPIRFELRLSGPSKAHPTPDPRKVRPHSLQPRKQVLKLRQFDLHLGFTGASASSEDGENELRSVQDANTDTILEGLTLRRRELVIEDHEIGVRGGHAVPKLIYLALPNVEAWMGGFDPLTHDIDDLTTGRVGQPGQLFEMLLGDALIEGLQRSPDEYGAIHAHAVVDQLGRHSAS